MLHALMTARIGRLRYAAICIFLLAAFMPWIARMLAFEQGQTQNLTAFEGIMFLLTLLALFSALFLASLARLRHARIPEWLALSLVVPFLQNVVVPVFILVPGKNDLTD